MEELRAAFRASIRSGDISDEHWSKLINNYLYYGGNPSGISRFIVEQYRKGLVDKNVLEFIKAINDPSRMGDVKRLLNAEVLPQNDPYFQDQGVR